jgi:hypothetical protein
MLSVSYQYQYQYHMVPSPDPSLAGRHIDVDLQLRVVSMSSDARQVAIIHISPGIPGNTRCHGSWGDEMT